MSGQLGELVVSLSADMARFRDDMGKAARVSQQTADAIARHHKDTAARISSAYNGIVGSAVVAGMALMTKEIVQAGLQLEKLNKLFNAAAGSANLGAREFAYVKQMADRMGLSFIDASQSYGKFVAAMRGTSMEGEKGRKVFEAVSGATTALGLSADETSGVFNALQQMISKGKVQAEELRGQLGERLPGAFKMAADAMGVSTAELDKMLQKGEVMAADLLPKLADQLNKTYGVAAAEGARSAQAELNRFNNAMLEAKGAAGSALLPVFTDILRMATPVAAGIRDITAAVQILGVKLAANAQKREVFWDNLFSGRGVFSAEGLERQKSAADLADKLALEAIDEILGKARGTTGADYTAAEKAAAAQRDKAAATQAAIQKSAEAATAAEQERQAYIKLYNSLQDSRVINNPLLSEEQREAAKLRIEYDNRISQFPQMRAELERNYALDLKQLQVKRDLTKAEEEWNQSLAETSSIAARAQAVGMRKYTALNIQQKEIGKFTPQQYSLTGAIPANSLWQGQEGATPRSKKATDDFASLETELKSPYDRQLVLLNQYYEEKKAIITAFEAENAAEAKRRADAMVALDKQVSDKKVQLEVQKWESVGGIMAGQLGQLAGMMDQNNKKQFDQWKALATAQATISTALAVAGILGAEAKLGMFAIPLAIGAGAIGLAQVAKIQSTQFQGRALGGPVTAGETYIVNENRATQGPEYFTPSVSGYITPANKIGGQSVNSTTVFQISTGVADTVRAEIARLAPALSDMAVNAVKSAMRNGEFQGVMA